MRFYIGRAQKGRGAQCGGVGRAAHQVRGWPRTDRFESVCFLVRGHRDSEDMEHGGALVGIDQNPAMLVKDDAADAKGRLAYPGKNFLATEGGEVPRPKGRLGSNHVWPGSRHGIDFHCFWWSLLVSSVNKLLNARAVPIFYMIL